MMRALIVDDEPPARQRLRDLLAEYDDVQIVGECGNAAQAAAAITQRRPDVVLLDIRMPGSDGFEVASALAEPGAPVVIFVTAFQEHAMQAWDVHAVDYLLKPFEPDRLSQALERARSYLSQPAPQRRRRLPVDMGGRIRFVDPADIDFARAERNYVRLHVRGRTYLVRSTLTALERRLDPAEFLRIHRSVIVRLDRVLEAQVLSHGEIALRMSQGIVVVCGRSYADRVRHGLGL